jgi:hypothetical protein
LVIGRVDVVDHPVIRLALDHVEFLAHGPPRGCHAVLVDQPGLAQLLHHHGHAAGFVEVLGHVFAAGLEVHEIGRVLEDVADVEQVEVDPGLVRDGGQVQPGVGGAAGAGHDPRRVFERLAGDDVAGADVLFDQVHDGDAGGLAILVTRFVRSRSAGGVEQRQADGLGDAGHGVGGELAAAGPGRGTGDALEDFKLGVGHVARLVLAHRFEHVLNGHVLAVQPARQDRAAVDEHRRRVQPDHRHHHARQRFVAPGKADDGVIAMAAHGQFDGVGDGLAAGQRRAHAFVAHGDAVGDGDGGEFAGRAAALLDPALDRLGLTVQRDVAGGRFVPAGRNAHPWLVDLLLRQAHGVEIAAVRGA